jgi:hypothetical protein
MGKIKDLESKKDNTPENNDKERYSLKDLLNDLRMEQQETV